MEQESIKRFFSTELLSWYRLIKRDLPWRINQDPYRVWVSEIMLQQTRVDTVIPFYNNFMSKFPTVKALAEAPETEVLKSWEGLGYYSRARNLQAGAREVVARYDGIVPDDKASVAGLKGVGPYTSGAIMSIAFNRPEPAVDGNVMRVLSRYFCLEDDIAKQSTRVSIEKLAASLIPEGAAGDFNQALMELGALVCTPKSPSCLPCPVMEHCSARLEGRELELPIKTKAKKARAEFRAAAIVLGSGENAGKVLVRQRPETGLLAQMWELPHLLLSPDQSQWLSESAPKEQGELAEMISRMLEEDTRLLIRPRSWFTDADHIFSHIHWKMRFYLADLGEDTSLHTRSTVGLNEDRLGIAAEAGAEYKLSGVATSSIAILDEQSSHYRWIGKEDMSTLPFPNLFLRILTKFWE
ncbi:A/G-specific adenine glycosylase [Paenibacillus sp. FSL H8-0548]|uniref:A/G-specific adenine glycosylase n=1 Tax=Paenibacillus sp. FSL H8-0548 TaxID=1920422 RepID=UPI00096DBD08|nr:A/G-specific adenine glycosylase [Paenibacillus sp. FSL H8-0548]OMF30879.1 A/G-specific adenine glycosylase [Paenibacillus sp. FSL H8-0548]